MQAVAMLNIEHIRLEKQDIKRLFEIKVINKEAYVYLALKLEQGRDKVSSVNVEEFAEDWNIQQSDVRKIITSLDSKNAIASNQPQTIQMELF